MKRSLLLNREISIKQLLFIFGLGCVFLMSSFTIANADIEGGKGVCRIIAVNNSGWLMPKSSLSLYNKDGVKRSAQVGEILQSGDRIEVMRGHYVQIAFDDNEDNVVHLVGETIVEIKDGAVTELNMSKGKLYALLDNLESGKKFEVSSPHSVASVRGTYFKVNTQDKQTEATLYKGNLRVGAMDPKSESSINGVALRAAMATIVEEGEDKPQQPVLVDESEFTEINNIIKLFTKDRELLSYDDATKLLERMGYDVDQMKEEAKSKKTSKETKLIGSDNRVVDLSVKKADKDTEKKETGGVVY